MAGRQVAPAERFQQGDYIQIGLAHLFSGDGCADLLAAPLSRAT